MASFDPNDVEVLKPAGLTFDPADVEVMPPPAAPPAAHSYGLRDFASDITAIPRGIVQTAASASDFAGRAIAHPVDTFAHPGAVLREGMRGVNENIPFANRAVQAMGGPPAESTEDAALAPGARAAGAVAGYPIGTMVGGIAGKAGGAIVEQAAKRVDERIIANIARGEAGGAAKASAADKMLTKTDVLPQLEQTGLTKTVATQAAAKPAKVADKVSKVIDEYTTQRIDPIYAAIDKAGAAPKGFEFKAKLQQAADRLKASGEWQQADHVERYLKFVDKSIPDGAQMTGSMLRKSRNEVGLGNTFASFEEGATPAGIKAKQEIYGAYNAAIEGAAAKVPGVDVASLKSANQTVSTLMTVRDALASRATKAAKGGTGFGTAVAGSIVRGGEAMALGGAVMHALTTGDIGALTHVAEGIVATEAGRYGLTHAAPQILRRADYGLSRLNLPAGGAAVGRATAPLAASKRARPLDDTEATP